MSSPRSTVRSLATVALAAAMSVSWCLQSWAAQSVANEATRATTYAEQIERSLMAIEDGRRQTPRDRWDPQYVVDTVGVDAGALYAWARENITWIPYRGRLRGPVGVLMDRTGNSLDMSLLLADLLRRSGQSVRLAHRSLDDDVLNRVWGGFEAKAAEATAPPADAPAVPTDLPPGVSDEQVQSIVSDADEPSPKAAAPDAVVVAQESGLTPAGSGGFGDTMGGSGSMFETLTGGGAGATAGSRQEAADLYELDRAAAEKKLADAATSRTSDADELDKRTLDQGGRLLSLFSASDDGAQNAYEHARARVALADHWWVQVEQGGAWVDYDLLALEGAPGAALGAATETMAPEAIPPELVHRVELRVVAEQLIRGKLQEGQVFEHEFVASELIGERISLRHLPMLWPTDWAAVTPDDVQEKLFAALLTQKEWMPALTVGDKAFQQSSILDTGAINPNPQPQSNPFLSVAFSAAGKVGRVADLFDQLLEESATPGDVAAEGKAPGEAARDAGELTAEWLEWTILAPGEKPKTTRREVFDILGPAMRRSGDVSGFRLDEDKQLARAGGEMTETEIVILPCWPAAEYLADKTAELALKNKPLLTEFTRDPFGKAPTNSVELFSKMSGMAGPAYLYATLRSEVSSTVGSVFVDRPQVIAQHGVLTRVGPGEMTAKAALDVVENGVGVDPFENDAFVVRVLQGVADTNAEWLALAGDGATSENVGQAYGRADLSQPWSVFFPEDRDRLDTLGLSPDLTARLMADLEAGHAVVSPGGSALDLEKAGWWRVDLASGATLGMGNRGWGSVLVEYAFYLVIQAMLAQISCMAFTAAAEEKINKLSAEQGREKVKEWAKNCVSQALLETVAGLSTSWITSRFLEGAKVPTWNDKAKNSNRPHAKPPSHSPSTNPSHRDPLPEAPSRKPKSNPDRVADSDGASTKPSPRKPGDGGDAPPTKPSPKGPAEGDKGPPTKPTPRVDDGADPSRPRPQEQADASRRPADTDAEPSTRPKPNFEDDQLPQDYPKAPKAPDTAPDSDEASTKRPGQNSPDAVPDSDAAPTQRKPNFEDDQLPADYPKGPNAPDTVPDSDAASTKRPGQNSPDTAPDSDAAPTRPKPNFEDDQMSPNGQNAQKGADRVVDGSDAAPATQRSPGNESVDPLAPTQRAPVDPLAPTERVPVEPAAPTQRSAGNDGSDASPATQRSPGNENVDPLAPTQRAPVDPLAPTERAPVEPAAPTQRSAGNDGSDAAPATQRSAGNENVDPLAPTQRAPVDPLAPTERAPVEPAAPTQRSADDAPKTIPGVGPDVGTAPTERAPVQPAPPTQRSADDVPKTIPGVGPDVAAAPIERAPAQAEQRGPDRAGEQRSADAVKPFSDARATAERNLQDARQRFDANRSPENFAALDEANRGFTSAYTAELDAFDRAGGTGAFVPGEPAPPTQRSPGQTLAQAPAATPQPLAANEAPSGANNTLAMGLASLAGTIQKGP